MNKFTQVFHASGLLLMINCVVTLSKWLLENEPQASGSAVNFDYVMTKMVKRRKLAVNKNK